MSLHGKRKILIILNKKKLEKHNKKIKLINWKNPPSRYQ
jgi:hypothetical protein